MSERDLRSQLAIARDEYLASSDGEAACDPATLGPLPNARQYLTNRIAAAFIAGHDAARPTPDGDAVRVPRGWKLVPTDENSAAFYAGCEAADLEAQTGTGPCGVFIAGLRGFFAASQIAASMRDNATSDESVRDKIGQAVNDYFADLDNGDGTIAFDHCSPDDIDMLVDAMLAAAPSAHCGDREAEARDAERWRALIGCSRIRLLGWAGLDADGVPPPESDGYVHFSAEFWTHYPEAVNEGPAAAVITAFADATIAAGRREGLQTCGCQPGEVCIPGCEDGTSMATTRSE
jgi:hypothetical protein